MRWKQIIARVLCWKEFQALEQQKIELENERVEMQLRVNQRVADVLFKMDPLEPILKKYHIVFPAKWEDDKPEQKLDSMGAMRLFMWAYGTRSDPNFLYIIDWIRTQQGNKTLRKAQNTDEWFFGRAAVATMTLFQEEIGRLSAKYEEVMAHRDQSFDQNLPVGEY